MKLQTSFASIISGALLAQSGCTWPDDCGELYPVEAVAHATIEETTVQAVTERLAAFEEANPEATASQKLEHLYGAGSEPLGGVTFIIRDLVIEAFDSGDGISHEACEQVCRSAYLDAFERCEAPPEGSQPVIVATCYGELRKQCIGGRRPAGLNQTFAGQDCSEEAKWWAQIHYMEKAAVLAFMQLAEELRDLGAPRELIDGCLQAAAEEIGHAQVTGKLAVDLGAQLWPVEPVEKVERSLFDLAMHNASEGCVRETYAGLEGLYQATQVRQDWAPMVHQIAYEECGHAELSWRIHAWACTQLSREQVAQIELVQREALAELYDAAMERDIDPFFAEMGLPDGPTALWLLGEMSNVTGVEFPELH